MPTKRIPPSQQMNNEIQRLHYELGEDNINPKSITRHMLTILVRKALQEMLEGEVDEFIGQPYYAQGDKRNGYRNGYESGHIKTAEGAIPLLTISCIKHLCSFANFLFKSTPKLNP